MNEEVMQQHVEGYRFIGADEKDRKIAELKKQAEQFLSEVEK